MPELPEVETIRRQLASVIVSKRVCEIQVLGSRVVRRRGLGDLNESLGAGVVEVLRVGKFLLVVFQDRSGLAMHLGMSGRLQFIPATQTASSSQPHLRLVVVFFDGSRMEFIDPRTFGQVFRVDAIQISRPYAAGLEGLGVDLLAPTQEIVDWSVDHFSKTSRSVKSFLLDQRWIAGLGNMYVDETLFRTGVHPGARCADLGYWGLERLVTAAKRVVRESIACGGSTFRDRSYRNLEGEGSYYGNLLVYQRHGRPCLLCYHTVERVRYQGRYSHFCSRCQRGRVEA